MTPPQPSEAHDRALLTAAATIAAPLVISGVFLLLYLTGEDQAGSLLLTGILVSAMAGASAAVIQAVRRVRSEVAAMRRETAALREQIHSMRVDAAVADIAALSADNVVPLRVNGTR